MRIHKHNVFELISFELRTCTPNFIEFNWIVYKQVLFINEHSDNISRENEKM